MTTQHLPAELYTAEQTRQLDRLAVSQGMDGFKLMQRAAQCAFTLLRQQWPKVRCLTLFAGKGNNGGDALVVAALAKQQGFDVQMLMLVAEPIADQLQGEALQAYQLALEVGVEIQSYTPNTELKGEVLVDGLLGTGISGAARGGYATAIQHINTYQAPVLALDIPSGVCADTGAIFSSAVFADMTISFIGVNRGLLTHQAVECVGRLFFDSLRVEASVYKQLPTNCYLSHHSDLAQELGRRKRGAHKGHCGHVLIVGGDHGYGGAALMAAQAAARSGAGLVSLATQAEHITAALTRCPEVMSRSVRNAADLEPLLSAADVIVVGPGLGKNAWGQQQLNAVLSTDKPLVLDADGLNLVSDKNLGKKCRNNWILTPHPGEAARLLGFSVAQVQQDRFTSVNALQQRYGGVALLKGAGTLVSDGQVTYLCAEGNPGMATGGMGDVLAGIIGALVAQGVSLLHAARLGAFLHAAAADKVAHRQGERGLLATDLLAEIPHILNGLDNE